MSNSFSQQGALPGPFTPPGNFTSPSGFSVSGNSPTISSIISSSKRNPGTVSQGLPEGDTSLYDTAKALSPAPSKVLHPGLLPGGKIGPLKSVTTSDGVTSTYHPMTPSGQQGTSSQSTNSPEQGTPRYYSNQIEQVSQPSAVGQGAANASALYGMLGNERQLAPFSGGTTQGLLNSYANLSRPQTTANQAGETALFDVQKGILQNAANTSAQQALEAQKIQQGGAEANLTASLPGQQGLTSTLYNPLGGANQSNNSLGERASMAGNVNNLQELQGKYNNIQATVHGINGLKGQLGSLLGTGVNPSDVNAVNSAIQRIAGNVSDPNYAKLNNLVSELSQRYASYLGSGGTVTNDVRDAAASLIPGRASAQTIMKVLDALDQQSNAVLGGYESQIKYIQDQLNQGQGFSGQNPQQNPQSDSQWTWN